MSQTLWFNGSPHGVLTGSDDYKNSAFDRIVLRDLLLTVNTRAANTRVFGVWANAFGDGTKTFANQPVWTSATCQKYTPVAAKRSGTVGAQPGAGFIHGLMLGPRDSDGKTTACVRKQAVAGLVDDLDLEKPEISFIAIGSDAAGTSSNPNPQGFGNWHNEGRHDFRALAQSTTAFNFGLLTTDNVGLIWMR